MRSSTAADVQKRTCLRPMSSGSAGPNIDNSRVSDSCSSADNRSAHRTIASEGIRARHDAIIRFSDEVLKGIINDEINYRRSSQMQASSILAPDFAPSGSPALSRTRSQRHSGNSATDSYLDDDESCGLSQNSQLETSLLKNRHSATVYQIPDEILRIYRNYRDMDDEELEKTRLFLISKAFGITEEEMQKSTRKRWSDGLET